MGIISYAKHKYRQLKASVREEDKRATRSPKWRTLEKYIIKIRGSCAACGTRKHLQVHHIQPFHTHPDLELEPSNLIVLCMDDSECHLLIGHGDDWHFYNPYVVSNADEYFMKPRARRSIIQHAREARKI